MAKRASIEDKVIRDVEKIIMKNASNFLKGRATSTFMKMEMKKAIKKTVYDTYQPELYDRRGSSGGLLDINNIKIKVSYKTNKVENAPSYTTYVLNIRDIAKLDGPIAGHKTGYKKIDDYLFSLKDGTINNKNIQKKTEVYDLFNSPSYLVYGQHYGINREFNKQIKSSTFYASFKKACLKGIGR